MTQLEKDVKTAKGLRPRQKGRALGILRDTAAELEATSRGLATAGEGLAQRLGDLQRQHAGDPAATNRLKQIGRISRARERFNANNLGRARTHGATLPKATARFVNSNKGTSLGDGGAQKTPLLPSGKPPKPPGGKVSTALGVAGHAMAAVDVINDIERGHYAQAGGKTATYALSLRAPTPWTVGLAVAWGAYEHKDDPDIKREAHANGDRVTDYTGSRVLGGMVAAKVTVELAVSAAVMDMARASVESSLAGQLFRMLSD